MKQSRSFFMGVLAAMLVLTASTFLVNRASASTGCFPDSVGHWAETFICFLKDNGISSGYQDGTFKPDNSITRGEMAVFLQKIFNLADTSAQAKADAAEANAIQSSQLGVITVQAPATGWYPATGNMVPATFSNFANAFFLTVNSNGLYYVEMAPTLPLAMYGRAAKLTGFQFCYGANANTYIDYVRLLRGSFSSSLVFFEDLTDRTTTLCPTFMLNSPHTLDPNETIWLSVIAKRVNAGGSLTLGSVNFYIDTAP